MSCPEHWSLQALKPHRPLLLLLLAYFAVRALYFDYPLIWDARWYYNEFVLQGIYHGDHNSYFWLWLSSWPNYFFPRSYYAYNVWIALLSTAGVAAFYVIVSELSAGSLGAGEKLLVTALFAFHPSVFVNEVHVTLDTGLVILWIWYLLALLKEKTLIATIVGCGFVFTKEPALAHLPILFSFCLLRQPIGCWWLWLKRHCIAAVLPLAGMGLFLYYKAAVLHRFLFFEGFMQSRDRMILTHFDANLVNYLLMAFVLNFSWILMCLSGFLTFRLFRKMPKADHGMVDRKQVLAAAWLLAATTGAVLAVRHFSNVRYLLPVFPAMTLYFASVLPVIASIELRFCLLVTLLAAFGLQNVRTVDPVSKASFCNAIFGTHSLLFIPDFKVCVSERQALVHGDRFVYNLEILHIPYLINAAMQDLRPDKNAVFVYDRIYRYELFDRLDKNYHITYDNTNPLLRVQYLQGRDDLDWMFHTVLYFNPKPEAFYYLEFPTANSESYRKYFQFLYARAQEKRYDIHGYRLTVIKFSNKP